MAKPIKAKNQKNLILFAIIIIFVLVGALAYSKSDILNSLFVAQNESQPTKTFESKYLKFKIDLPYGFQATDETSRITINSNQGQMSITRNGTNYSKLEDYISDFDSKRKLTASEAKNVLIDGHEALYRNVEYPDQSFKQKSYYIFVGNAVYIFSTSSEAFYDELDQIAQSFKYTGK